MGWESDSTTFTSCVRGVIFRPVRTFEIAKRMNDSTLNTLLVYFGAGLGVLALGAVQFFFSRYSTVVKLGVGGSIATACALLPLYLGHAVASLSSLAIVWCTLGIVGLLHLNHIPRFVRGIGMLSRRAGFQATIMVASGVAMMAGSIVHFSEEEEKTFDRDTDFMVELAAQPPLYEEAAEPAVTDLGRPLSPRAPSQPRDQKSISISELESLQASKCLGRVIRLEEASDTCNCYGWLFTGGRYWLSQTEVEFILDDNGYQIVSDPQPGDVVIYRKGNSILHAGVVRMIGDGQQVFVAGKWGWMGVFLHRIDDSLYGKSYQVYRSNRVGHVVKGLKPQG